MTKRRLARVLCAMALMAAMTTTAVVSILKDPQTRSMWSTFSPWLMLNPTPAGSVPQPESRTHTSDGPSDPDDVEPSVAPDSSFAPAVNVEPETVDAVEISFGTPAPTADDRDLGEDAVGIPDPIAASSDALIDYGNLSKELRHMADALERFNTKLRDALAEHTRALEREQPPMSETEPSPKQP